MDLPSTRDEDDSLRRRQGYGRTDDRSILRSGGRTDVRTDSDLRMDSVGEESGTRLNASESRPRGRTASRKSRLRGSFRRMRRRGTSTKDGQRQRDDEELADDILREILAAQSSVRGGKALLKGDASLDLLRESGLTMKVKKRVLAEARRERTARNRRREQGVGCCTLCSASLSMRLQHFRQRVADAVYSVNFWESSIKAVEGQFGTGVGSYFRFLKWLFLLNIPIFLLCFSFVTLPQLLYDFFPSVGAERIDEECRKESFFGWELLTGRGNFSCSPLYYGHYTNSTVSIIPGADYSMPLFYILSIGLYFLINLVAIALRISASYRANFIEGSGDLRFFFVNKVFAGWDFGVFHSEAAALKKKSLRQEIGEYISLVLAKAGRKGSARRRASSKLQLAVTNLVVVAMLVGCGFLVHHILHANDEGLQGVRSQWIVGELLTSMIVTAIVVFVPKIFSLLTLIEKYRFPQTSLYMTLVRSVSLYGVVVGLLLHYWATSINCEGRPCRRDPRRGCWENEMGQEIYKLVVMDFVVALLDCFFTDFLRSLIVRHIVGRMMMRPPRRVSSFLPNFNVALNTLNLIYSQSLVWFGIFYSPLLPVVQLLKLLLLFHLKKITVLKNCAPFKRAWRGARIQTIFLVLLFFGFMTAIILLGCGIYLANPSPNCGPYRGREKVNDALLDFVGEFYEDARGLYGLIAFLSSSWFIIALLIFLAIKVYYARVSANARLQTISMLKNQLQLSSFDKQFLLQQIQQNTRIGSSPEKSVSSETESTQINNPYGCSRGGSGGEPRNSPAKGNNDIDPNGQGQGEGPGQKGQPKKDRASTPSGQRHLTPPRV